jgi:hypothetical protein
MFELFKFSEVGFKTPKVTLYYYQRSGGTTQLVLNPAFCRLNRVNSNKFIGIFYDKEKGQIAFKLSSSPQEGFQTLHIHGGTGAHYITITKFFRSLPLGNEWAGAYVPSNEGEFFVLSKENKR